MITAGNIDRPFQGLFSLLSAGKVMFITQVTGKYLVQQAVVIEAPSRKYPMSWIGLVTLTVLISQALNPPQRVMAVAAPLPPTPNPPRTLSL